MPDPLKAEEVRLRLASLPGWTDAARGWIEKTFRFDDFRSAAEFVCRVAAAADAANHHPECEVAWGRVTVRLRTHEAGGITERDVDLARALERLPR